MALITVSDKVKDAFRRNSIAAYKTVKVEPKNGSSQAANALALYNTLVEFKLIVPENKDKSLGLEIAYIGGNTSQARQAIVEASKTETGSVVAADLLAASK